MRKSIRYIGLDVSKSFTVATAIIDKGELIKQVKLSNFTEEWYSFFDKISKNSKLQIAFEANSMLRKFFNELSKYGEVRVAHPAKVKLIAETKLKTDRKDSLTLAKLLRLSELPEVYVCKDEEILKLRALTRERQRLKQISARFKCQIRHLLLQNGIILEGNIFTKEKREELRSYCIEEIDRRA
ncbi:MAG: transposase [Candidatus Bathyarchaeia archaeon]